MRPPRSNPLGVLILVLATGAAQLPAVRAAPGQTAPWSPPDAPPLGPISAAEYEARRAALMRQLDDGVFLALGTPEPEADYLPFAQDADFLYLTGVTEPDAALVMVKRGDEVRERLFVRSRDPAREIWEGPGLGVDGARVLTGIDAAPRPELIPFLDSILAGHRTLFTPATLRDPAPGRFLNPQEQLLAQLAAGHRIQVMQVRRQIAALRARKSPRELDLIRRAVYITNVAHNNVMRAVEPGLAEFEVQALLEHTFRRYGADRPAFASIVGSGPNSTTLHYNQNDRFMEDGDVVLVDIGASYRGYAADVTRTIPVNGRFSPEQRAIYETVLAAQKAAEERARPGGSMADMSRVATQVLAEGLARLGLIESPDAVYDSPGGPQPQYRLFYMHSLGHGVGLDVHDPNQTPIAEGSAFTIEPGIYVREDVFDFLPDTPRNRAMAARLRPAVDRYRRIGVRIEDVYVVTAGGLERVSAGAPREIDEIEALMSSERIGRRDRLPHVVDWFRQTEP